MTIVLCFNLWTNHSFIYRSAHPPLGNRAAVIIALHLEIIHRNRVLISQTRVVGFSGGCHFRCRIRCGLLADRQHPCVFVLCALFAIVSYKQFNKMYAHCCLRRTVRAIAIGTLFSSLWLFDCILIYGRYSLLVWGLMASSMRAVRLILFQCWKVFIYLKVMSWLVFLMFLKHSWVTPETHINILGHCGRSNGFYFERQLILKPLEWFGVTMKIHHSKILLHWGRCSCFYFQYQIWFRFWFQTCLFLFWTLFGRLLGFNNIIHQCHRCNF